MCNVAFALLLIGFMVMTTTTIRLGMESRSPSVTINCETWASVDDCFRDGVARNWRQLEGIIIIGPEGRVK